MTIHWRVVEQYFTVVLCLFFNFTRFIILEHLSVLDLALSGVKGFILKLTSSNLLKAFLLKEDGSDSSSLFSLGGCTL